MHRARPRVIPSNRWIVLVVGVIAVSSIALSDSVVRIDGTGKYLIPGLWDMHVHAWQADGAAAMLPLFVVNGVTGIREMWGDLAVVAAIRAAVDSGKQVSPRWVVAGGLVDGAPPWLPGAVVAADPQRGRQVVDSLAPSGQRSSRSIRC